MSLKESAIIDQIAESCRILGLLDITHAALGHVSHRMEGRDAMYIKGKGPLIIGSIMHAVTLWGFHRLTR